MPTPPNCCAAATAASAAAASARSVEAGAARSAARAEDDDDDEVEVLCCSAPVVSGACPSGQTLTAANCATVTNIAASVVLTKDAGASLNNRNFYAEAQSLGYAVVNDRMGMYSQYQTTTPLIGIFHSSHMHTWLDRHTKTQNIAAATSPLPAANFAQFSSSSRAPLNQPDLAEMTDVAIKKLARTSANSGFFLMVEGANIDKQEHPFDNERAFDEMIDFDNAVGVGLDYARAHGDTLVIVTCDHGHGFEVFGTADTEVFNAYDNLSADPAVKKALRTANGVLVYQDAAFPTYVDNDGDGFPDNFDTSRFNLAVGYADVVDEKHNFQSSATPRNPNIGHALPGSPAVLGVPSSATGNANLITGGSPPATGIFANDASDVHGVNHGVQIARNMATSYPASSVWNSMPAWANDGAATTGVHTMQDVPIYSEGPGSELIAVQNENTDIFLAIAQALGVGE
jgi:hypothetical protein